MKKLLLLLLLILGQCAFAQSFDFNSSGDKNANKILKEYISTKYELDEDDINTVAYIYDNKILGIVKLSMFYNLEGYKLIVLKKTETDYKYIKNNIFFDNTKNLIIEDNKITYYKSPFYKNKEYTASIKEDEIKTYKSINDKLTDRKVKHIGHVTYHTKNENSNNIELSDFKVVPQKKVNIKYNNLNNRTKHYLEMQ